MEQAGGVAAIFQFGGGELGVDFRAGHRPKTVMNKKQSHRESFILNRRVGLAIGVGCYRRLTPL